MISWIQRTFQHHFRAVFAVLLAVTIISFIATIGAAPGIGNGDRRVTEQDFYGRNLADASEASRIRNDADLSLTMRPENFNRYDPDQVQQYGLVRVAALHLADDWHLPSVNPESPEMVDFIKHVPFFQGQDGQFDPARYAQVRTMLRTQGRFGEADVARVLAEDYRIEAVKILLGGPGYILPDDVRNDLARYDATWTLATATVDYVSFQAATRPSDAELTRFFGANAGRYTIPAKVAVSYVEFPAAAYLSQVPVTDAEVRAYYDRDPARFPKAPPAADKNGRTPAIKVDPAADFAAVKSQVESAFRLEKARALASKAASDFSYGLYQNRVASGAPLDTYLASRHVTAKSLPPFSADAPPAELGGSGEAASAAFQLTAQHFYSEAASTPNGAVVLLWKGNEAPRQPMLPEVRAKALADLAAEQKHNAFAAAGARLKADVAARLKQGTPFEKAAIAAGAAAGLKVTVKTLPPFKLSDGARDLSPAVLQTLENLTPGQVSDLTFEGDNGTIVFAAARKTPDLGDASPRFAEVRKGEGMQFARVTADLYLTQMVVKKLQQQGLAAHAE